MKSIPENRGELVEYTRRHGEILQRFLVPPECSSAIDAALKEQCIAKRAHGNARAVVICHIDEQTYSRRIAEKGAKPIQVWFFLSARAASTHFGYPFNAVAQALAKAKQDGETTARLGGVTFMWADEMAGVD